MAHTEFSGRGSGVVMTVRESHNALDGRFTARRASARGHRRWVVVIRINRGYDVIAIIGDVAAAVTLDLQPQKLLHLEFGRGAVLHDWKLLIVARLLFPHDPSKRFALLVANFAAGDVRGVVQPIPNPRRSRRIDDRVVAIDSVVVSPLRWLCRTAVQRPAFGDGD